MTNGACLTTKGNAYLTCFQETTDNTTLYTWVTATAIIVCSMLLLLYMWLRSSRGRTMI
jgi:hypothetical protein